MVSYNSSKKLVKFIKKIPKQTPILIIDNSKDFKLKRIFKKKIKIFQYILRRMKVMEHQLIMQKKLKQNIFLSYNLM